jgi:hypothetical protein
MSGHSGSPVYCMEKTEDGESCCVVGIHKGYDPKLKRNVCVLLQREMIEQLERWTAEMNLSIRVRTRELSRPIVSRQSRKESN